MTTTWKYGPAAALLLAVFILVAGGREPGLDALRRWIAVSDADASASSMSETEAADRARAFAADILASATAAQAAPERPVRSPIASATVGGKPLNPRDMEVVEMRFQPPSPDVRPLVSQTTGSQYVDEGARDGAWLVVLRVSAVALPGWETTDGVFEVEVLLADRGGKLLQGGTALMPQARAPRS